MGKKCPSKAQIWSTVQDLVALCRGAYGAFLTEREAFLEKNRDIMSTLFALGKYPSASEMYRGSNPPS